MWGRVFNELLSDWNGANQFLLREGMTVALLFWKQKHVHNGKETVSCSNMSDQDTDVQSKKSLHKMDCYGEKSKPYILSSSSGYHHKLHTK